MSSNNVKKNKKQTSIFASVLKLDNIFCGEPYIICLSLNRHSNLACAILICCRAIVTFNFDGMGRSSQHRG